MKSETSKINIPGLFFFISKSSFDLRFWMFAKKTNFRNKGFKRKLSSDKQAQNFCTDVSLEQR